MIGKLLAPLWAKIALGFAVALILALGVQTWRLSSAHAQNDKLRTALATEQARHAVTRNSVETLERTIREQNEIVEARAEQFAAAQKLAVERDAELARIERDSDTLIRRLQERAKQPGSLACVTPADLAKIAKGL